MIWLVGNRGMLGQEVALRLQELGLEAVGTDTDVDITDPTAIERFLAGHESCDWIVNCAAYTAVDRAEDEPDAARVLNVDAVGNLAEAARRRNARMLHISTDYVFNGTEDREIKEDEPPAPASVYGQTKTDGEAALRSVLTKHIIVRTAWLYGLHGKNFVYTMLRLMREREELRVVDDQHGTPTYAVDLAHAIGEIVRRADPEWGTYHFTNRGRTTWYRFALEIQNMAVGAGLLDGACRVVPVTSADFPTKARRPHYSLLSTENIEQTFGIRPPPWEESLGRFFAELSDNTTTDN